jgi:hypothetical protein
LAATRRFIPTSNERGASRRVSAKWKATDAQRLSVRGDVLLTSHLVRDADPLQCGNQLLYLLGPAASRLGLVTLGGLFSSQLGRRGRTHGAAKAHQGAIARRGAFVP